MLANEFPGLLRELEGARVLDHGCGRGDQAIALAVDHRCRVWALDTNAKTLERARCAAEQAGVPGDRIVFLDRWDPNLASTFDYVISHDSMEHYSDPLGVLNVMTQAVVPGGDVAITFGNPWYHPYGAHMSYFTPLPWVHLLFSERTVMSVRSRFRADGARRYQDVESGLNRMSVAKFERLLSGLPVTVRSRRYRCIRGMDWLARLPVIRELFTNRVSCLLRRSPE